MNFDYFLSTENNSTLYFGRKNTVFIESEFLENEEINFGVEIKPLKNCVTKGVYPILEIIPTNKPTCAIEIYFRNKLKKTQNFVVADLPNPYLTSNMLRDLNDESSTTYDEVIGQSIYLANFRAIKQLNAKIIKNGAGTSCLEFIIVQFDFSVLRDKQIVFYSPNSGKYFNDEIEDFKYELQIGDRIIIENILCRLNSHGDEKLIERLFNYNVIEIR